MATRVNNVRHKSAEDFRRSRMNGAIQKLGGQEQADEILVQWENHKRAEKDCDRRKREADGFVRGVLLSHKLSREETMVFFRIGRHRFERLRDLDPSLPPPTRRTPGHAVTAEDKELVRLFMQAQPTDCGYPCHHRSTPVYLADPSTTMAKLHQMYKLECHDRMVRVLSYFTFRMIVKYLLPTLHLGRNKIDTCNSCFSMDLQIKDPETSEELRQELIAAKQMHLNDAINQRKAINRLVKAVKEEAAPGDPPLKEEPVYVPECFNDPFDRLNRPFIIDHEDGTVGLSTESIDPDQSDTLGNLIDVDHDNSADDEGESEFAEVASENEGAPRKLRVSIQDFGSGIPLPRYGGNQPNHDYYASNLTLHNMNFVECATGETNISYYDERQSGKDGNSVCSLRMNNTRQHLLQNRDNLPTAECKVMDNCVAQNKSNQTHKFSMFTSLLLFPDGVTDIYFRVGHSHNQSDMKTAHANKGLDKKNLFTPDEVAFEVNRIKGLKAEVLDDRKVVFFDWKAFLDRHLPNMEPGFTSYFFFEFKEGIVSYKDLLEDGTFVTAKTQIFCPDPAKLRKTMLRELFNLNETSNVVEICKAKVRLPPLPQKRISAKKVENMKTLYQQIPRSKRWFYPEGESVQDDPHTDLRSRAAQMGLIGVAGAQSMEDQIDEAGERGVENVEATEEVAEGDLGSVGAASIVPSARRLGRPRKLAPPEKNQPSIFMFMRQKESANNNRTEIIDSSDSSDNEVIVEAEQSKEREEENVEAEQSKEREDVNVEAEQSKERADENVEAEKSKGREIVNVEAEQSEDEASDSDIDILKKKYKRFVSSDTDSDDGDKNENLYGGPYLVDLNDNDGKIKMMLRRQPNT